MTGSCRTLLISTGLVGRACYVAFFGYGISRYRRDQTPYGMAGELVLLLEFIFFFVYEAMEHRSPSPCSATPCSGGTTGSVGWRPSRQGGSGAAPGAGRLVITPRTGGAPSIGRG